MKKQRTVLVTGGAGFIGSNFLNTYVPEHPDWSFVNVDCLTYAGNHENVTVQDAPNYVFADVDIRDQAALKEVWQQYQPTHVIHFAAESHVDRSIESATVFVETNVTGTLNLLQLAKDTKVERFHHISTDEVYGAFTSTEGAFAEIDALAPRNPYSASKAAADLMVLAYHETHDLPVVITRSSNVYGPHQDTTKLMPKFIRNLQAGEAVTIYGEGKQMREWTYVSDCVAGIHAVFNDGQIGEVYNIGSGEEATNLEITKQLIALCGRDESAISYVEDRLGHDFRYALTTDKIKTNLGWEAQIPLAEGLQKTVAFYTAA